MKSKRLVMFGLLLVALCLVATPIYAQPDTPVTDPAAGSAAEAAEPASEPTPTPAPVPVNARTLAQELADPALWGILFLAFVAGGLGGLAYELITLQGSLELWHRLTPDEVTEAFPYAQPKYMFDLGSGARIIIGGLAAVAVFFVFSPGSAFELIAVAIIAGSAGTAIFRSLQDRVTSALALQEVTRTRARAAEIEGKVEEAAAALDAMAQIPATAGGQPGVRAFEDANSSALQEARQLLAEARALSESLKR